MGFLKNESLQVIVDAPRDNRIYNSFNFILKNILSMPISESGLLVKFFIAAKFNNTIPSGWPVLQIRRRIHTSDSSYLREVFSITMEPRPTGYLNVFEYDVQNMTFDVQHNDSIRVFWPQITNVSRRYSLAYFRDNSNIMLSIETQHHTEPVTTATVSGGNHDLIITTSSDALENVTFSMIITDAPTKSGAPNVTTITLSTNNTTTIIIGCLICTILALVLLSIATVIIVLTYRHHKNKTAPYATQQASKDFDMDSNQAYTTREDAKHDEAVNCIEMDSNQAYITHSETKFKGEQGAGKKEMEANQAYIDTDTLPTDPNVAYGTVDCIEVDANQAYGTNVNTLPTDPNVAYGTVDCIAVDANQAYGTNTVPTDPNVAYDTHPNDYDYIALP
jgi:hypothetical protein